ncbi:hypothetical protein GCM10011400_24120 [Paraburkholderia caffeinilytica]|uniref:Reverse transcriptase domain-containing protein n=2 Tax=Paraburkholderia caffeinilytica TaxID=1761016 RepID=A0ABQ1M8G8_9BURK|nr:hypothetical protein GCM10011400_24120 [Paraburkholderia caffeinilytica]CAB3791395.1 hypothetical protein LMG28690_03269 [Paraburkholderia caffeinilytica]
MDRCAEEHGGWVTRSRWGVQMRASHPTAAIGTRSTIRAESRVTSAKKSLFRGPVPASTWQPPRIIPQLVLDRALNPLVYGYRYDPQFQQWRRLAALRRKELIEAIRLKSLRLVTERPGRTLKDAVKSFFRSRLVHFDELHRTWVDGNGPFGHQTLPERQAALYARWRAWQQGGELLQWSLDPSIACAEPFYRRGKPKRDGGWRTFYSFGIARTTRQRLVHVALTAASCDQYRAQAMYDGGMSAVVDEVRRMLIDNPLLTHCAKIDIRNCFDNIQLGSAHGVLPLAPKVIQQTVAINAKEAVDQRERDHRRHDRYLRRREELFASGPSLALPQGAASSPFVAYSLIEAGLPPLSPDREFLYGDDLLVLGESQDDVSAQVCRFRRLFERHPAGPLQIHSDWEEEPRDVRDGFEFLGIQFRRVVKMADGVGSFFVSARLPLDARAQFLDNVRARVDHAREYGDKALSDASRYVRGFLGSRPTDDRVELLIAACLVIEERGIDAAPIWELGAS